MIPKKLLLFSASLILFACVGAHAQEAATAAPAQRAEAATPVAQAESPLLAALATGGDNYLGIAATEVTRENMGRYNLREPRGVVILRVAAGSPAERAGLKAGDVILRFDGEQVTTHSKLQRLINEAAPEQNIRLTISRNGTEQEISVTLGRRTDGLQALAKVYSTTPNAEARRSLEQLQRNQGVMALGWGRRIGVSTTQLTRQLADYFNVPGGRGLLITAVSENSPASRAGLKAGDVIMDVDGQKIESAGDLSRAINRQSDGDITLTIIRNRERRTLRVTPEKREPGAINASPELLEISPEAFEFSMPTIDIRIPQIKQVAPITIPRIKIPKIEIKPGQLQKIEPLIFL